MPDASRIGIAATLALALGLGGCSGTREALGLVKDPPDEFQVVSRAPLSMPPDFGLRPPQPGAPRPQEGTARDQAENAVFGDMQPARTQTALFGNLVAGGALGGDSLGDGLGGDALGDGSAYGAGAAGPSAGEQALLAKAGAAAADPSIRAKIDRETAAIAEADDDFMEHLVFWRDPLPFGTVVDPSAEQQRLQENAALGRPVTEGETPTIERKKRALLEGLF